MLRKFNDNLSGPQQLDGQQRETTVSTKQMQLIKLSDEQIKKKSSKLKFVYELPTTKEEVLKVMNELESEEDVLIALQRIRDLHNPTLQPIESRQKKEREFDKFSLSLLLSFVNLKEEQSVFAQTVALHLKDIVARANKT